MKAIIPLAVVVIVVAAGAYFTRPSEADFDAYVRAKSGNEHHSMADNLQAFASGQTMVYHDHLFWVIGEQGGKTRYVGAFEHWFDRGMIQSSKTPAP